MQFAYKALQSRLNTAGIQCSKSRTGNRWDNAVAERFFHSLKVELIHGMNSPTRQEARSELFDYIQVFDDRQQRHSALDYQTPAELEERAIAA